MMKIVSTIILIVLNLAVFGQKIPLHTKSKKAISKFDEATKMYGMRYTSEAENLAKEAIEIDSNFLEAQMFLGELYLDNQKYELAQNHLSKALELDQNHDYTVIYRMLAESEINLLMLQEAIDHLEAYMELPEVSDYAKKKAQELIDLALFRKTMVENPVPFNPVNLGAQINSEWYEHSPTLTVDEQTLFFTRKEPYDQVNGVNYFDENLYRSRRMEDGSWSEAKMLGKEINTEWHEGASSISPDGKYLFFTRCKKERGMDNCDIYIARREGGRWVNVRSLGQQINTRFWESQPAFSTDGRTLYFVRRVGARNATHYDILRTRIQDNGQWTKPEPISICTSGNEESPFLHPDGETFYFSSDSYPGMGGRDLFMVKIDSNGEFGEPVNLGYPINSYRDEVSLIVAPNGERAYYASGKKGGYGKWDLYSFELPQKVRPVPVNYTKGLVYNKETKEPVGAKFEIIDLVTGNIVVESFSDRKTGKFLVTVPTGKEYAVNVSASGYLFFSANYSLAKGDDSSRVAFDIPLSPIQKGEAIVLNNVFFEFNSYALKPESKVELNLLVELLNKNPELKIEIGGHTDNKGSKQYNQKLSENRAKSVYEYLISQGISADRLSYKGYDFSQPIATNDTEEGRAKNRRTEFKIIDIQ